MIQDLSRIDLYVPPVFRLISWQFLRRDSAIVIDCFVKKEQKYPLSKHSIPQVYYKINADSPERSGVLQIHIIHIIHIIHGHSGRFSLHCNRAFIAVVAKMVIGIRLIKVPSTAF